MKIEEHSLVGALGLEAAGALVSIVGGGGKSALLFALADRLPGRVVTTTTTRIFAAQMSRARETAVAGTVELDAALARDVSGLLVVAEIAGEKALGVSSELPAAMLRHPSVDYVVVEADGSRMRPVKAPAEHEPVVPAETDLLVVVVGIDALRKPLRDAAHRAERVAALTGTALDEKLSAASLAELLGHPNGGLKRLPDRARAIALINKVESPDAAARAAEIARATLAAPRFSCVIAGALEGETPNRWTVYRRNS